MYALNFYSPMVADQLRSRRKTATIRLGDKSGKYKKGMVVQVLVGTRFGPREKVFEAVIDKVEVKDLMDLSPREIEHDNPEIRRPEEMLNFLSRLYNREIAPDEQPEGNRFPTADGLLTLFDEAALEVHAQQVASELGAAPQDWEDRADRVDAQMADRYADSEAWKTSQQQSERMGSLLGEGAVVGTLFSLRAS